MRSSTSWTLRHHVLAVDHDRAAARRAQRYVQDRAILGDVDLLAREHRVDSLAQARFTRQLKQEAHGLLGDAMLGVVQVQPGVLGDEMLAAAGILREQRAQMNVANLVVMLAQRFPGRTLGKRKRFRHVRHLPRSAGFFELGGLVFDNRHQVVPGLDEGVGAFTLQLLRQRVGIDSGLGELGHFRFRVAAVAR